MAKLLSLLICVLVVCAGAITPFRSQAQATSALVIAHANRVIQPLANRLDVRDEHDLLKAVLQLVQQLHNVVPPLQIQ